MKELTIEQKAQAYDKALKVLHKYDGANIMFSQSLKEEMFPELKESEESGDERFKNFISNELACLRATNGKGSDRYEELTKAINWLEKQGKPTYNKELSELLHEVICRFINDSDIPYSDREKVSMKLLPYVELLEKQGEQKPNIVPIFKVGDIIKNKKNGDTVKVVQILSDSYCYLGWDGVATIHSDFLISDQGNWELVEQKPTKDSAKVSESSTEEKDMGEYKKGFECGKQRVLKYPEDFGLCKKPAWSEEDENRINRLIAYFEDKESFSAEDDVIYANWLKSLKDRYTWKPTKEQIMALRWVLNHIPYDSHKEEISGLLEQLMKLYNYAENR